MIYPNEAQTAENVENHYNDLDQYYRTLWGEHLHHGYWKWGNETVKEATTALIDLVAKVGEIKENDHVLDVGCGYGATSHYLAHQIGATVTALTVSKAQWQYARAHDPESTNPKYILGNFLHNDFKPESFDIVLSIESSEHMVDKPQFFSESFRLTKPGGRFVTCAWLAKENPTPSEVKHLLEPICREGRLPSMGSETEYRQMLEDAGYQDITFQDISEHVKKTWSICIWRAGKAFINDKNIRKYILSKNSKEKIFAKTLFRIWAAYQMKAMRYGVFCARKIG